MAVTGVQSYGRYVSYTKSDTVNFDGSLASAAGKAIPCDAIYVGGAGIIQAVDESGIVVPFTCVAGETVPIRAIRVNSTSTTATLLVALYYV